MKPDPATDNFSVLANSPSYDDAAYIPKGGDAGKPQALRPLLSPHGITLAKLEETRKTQTSLVSTIAAMPVPRIAVLAGGTSKHAVYTMGNWEKLATSLSHMRERIGGSLMMTTSRRTGSCWGSPARASAPGRPGFFLRLAGAAWPGQSLSCLSGVCGRSRRHRRFDLHVLGGGGDRQAGLRLYDRQNHGPEIRAVSEGAL